MKALIPAAGYGTRFFPASLTVPKEMLPIGSRPALQLIVEEALAAGAERVTIVTSPGKPSLRRHFEPGREWAARCSGRPEAAAELERLEELGRRIDWVVQTEQKGLGHAVLQAADALADEQEPVLVLLGDALVSGEAPSATMAAISQAYGGASVVGLEEVPLERVSRYGIVKGLEGFKGLDGVKGITCLESVKGSKGPKGVKGVKGVKGLMRPGDSETPIARSMRTVWSRTGPGTVKCDSPEAPSAAS